MSNNKFEENLEFLDEDDVEEIGNFRVYFFNHHRYSQDEGETLEDAKSICIKSGNDSVIYDPTRKIVLTYAADCNKFSELH